MKTITICGFGNVGISLLDIIFNLKFLEKLGENK